MATATSSSRYCAHCGLPVTAACATNAAGELFCCHACRLVAAVVGNRQGDGPHAANLLRLGLGTILAMNVMTVSLLLYAQSVAPPEIPAFRLILLALSVPALAILLPPFAAGALRDAEHRTGSLDLLIALGSLCAFSVSAVNTLRGRGEVYFDTATMLPVLVTVGKVIESSAKRRAAELLHALETLLPETALRVRSEGSGEVAPDELRPGDLVRVRPGERVAVDGTILEGESELAEAPFSGEYLPRRRRAGDRVTAGTVNGAGALLVRAERTGSELLLRRIAALVEDGWRNPSRSERVAQRAAELFLPAVAAVASASLLGWWLAGDPGRALLSAVSVLVVACPCTMGIATPLATSLAVARAARSGVVVRGGAATEALAGIRTMYFDKTGTLTMGQPELREIRMLHAFATEEELLGRAAALEAVAGHALGRAVMEKARERGIAPGEVTDVQPVAGKGIRGRVTWGGSTCETAVGSPGFVEEAGAPSPEGRGGPVETEEGPTGDCSVVSVA